MYRHSLASIPKAECIYLILFCPAKHQSQSTWTLWMALHTIFRGNLKKNTDIGPTTTTAWLWISNVAKWPWKSGTVKYFPCTITVCWGHFEQKKIKSIKQSYLRIISDMISKIFALVRSQFETELFTVHFETRTSCLLLRECHIMATWVVKFSREGCKIRYCIVAKCNACYLLGNQLFVKRTQYFFL